MTLDRKLKFTWEIHYKCNFRCPYCWFYANWADLVRENIYLSPKEWFEHWMNIYRNYGEAHIEITGGEPFLYPGFIELIKLLSKIHTIKITTNMSGDIKKFSKETDPGRVSLDLNFHPLFSDLEAYIEKVLILKNAGFKCSVCYLAYPPQIKQINNLSVRFEKEGIGFALAAFWGEYGGKKYPESYTSEETEVIKPFLGDAERIKYHLKGDSPKGRACYAGHRYAVVRANGNVTRCGQLPNTIMGNISDKDVALLDKAYPCEATYCPCNEYTNLDDSMDCKRGSKENKINRMLSESEFTANKTLNKREVDEKKLVLQSKPLKLGIIVTDRCNLSCIMCPSIRKKGVNSLSRHAIENVYEALPYLERINWQGGEFFLIDYFKDVFRHMKDYKNIIHEITTNGLLLDEEWISLFLDLRVGLIFSIDSVVPETYQHIRRGGDLNKLIKRINFLNEMEQYFKIKPEKKITIAVMRSNLTELELFVDFAARYNFSTIIFHPVHPIMETNLEEDIFSNATPEVAHFLGHKMKNVKKMARDRNIAISDSLPRMGLGRNRKVEMKNRSSHQLFCSWPWASMWVDACREGNVYPDCMCSRELGNISEDGILKFWNNDTMVAYRKNILDRNMGLCVKNCTSGLMAPDLHHYIR